MANAPRYPKGAASRMSVLRSVNQSAISFVDACGSGASPMPEKPIEMSSSAVAASPAGSQRGTPVVGAVRCSSAGPMG